MIDTTELTSRDGSPSVGATSEPVLPKPHEAWHLAHALMLVSLTDEMSCLILISFCILFLMTKDGHLFSSIPKLMGSLSGAEGRALFECLPST